MDTFLKVMFTLLSLIGALLIGISVYFWVAPVNQIDVKDVLIQINIISLSVGFLYIAFVLFLWKIYKPGSIQRKKF